MERRPYPPGQHGATRKKPSEYAVRLKEKQKLRANYGVTEKQMRGLMGEARRVKGDAGKKLLELLERRLDNAVFRAGFAPTIPAARQMVAHGHVQVNGRRVDIPSFRVKRGDTVALTEAMRANVQVQQCLADEHLPRASWLEVHREQASARVVALPDETSVPFPLQVQLVVEYYAQSV
jgi:small subunit ribosomal protein S4